MTTPTRDELYKIAREAWWTCDTCGDALHKAVDAVVDAMQSEIAQLREDVDDLLHTRRWNINRTEEGIRICEGDHHRAHDCQWEYFVPAHPAGAAKPEALPPFEIEWAKKEAQGYRYGHDALEQVKLGYNMAEASLKKEKI